MKIVWKKFSGEVGIKCHQSCLVALVFCTKLYIKLAVSLCSFWQFSFPFNVRTANALLLKFGKLPLRGVFYNTLLAICDILFRSRVIHRFVPSHHASLSPSSWSRNTQTIWWCHQTAAERRCHRDRTKWHHLCNETPTTLLASSSNNISWKYHYKALHNLRWFGKTKPTNKSLNDRLFRGPVVVQSFFRI